MINDLLSGNSKARIAAKFHNTVAKMILDTCRTNLQKHRT